jgi:plastocyanin
MCGQNVEFVNVEMVVHDVVTTGLKGQGLKKIRVTVFQQNWNKVQTPESHFADFI